MPGGASWVRDRTTRGQRLPALAAASRCVAMRSRESRPSPAISRCAAGPEGTAASVTRRRHGGGSWQRTRPVSGRRGRGSGRRPPMQPDRPVKLTLKLTRHADHDPGVICRPAFGYGLCEVLEIEAGSEEAAERWHIQESSWRYSDWSCACSRGSVPCSCGLDLRERVERVAAVVDGVSVRVSSSSRPVRRGTGDCALSAHWLCALCSHAAHLVHRRRQGSTCTA